MSDCAGQGVQRGLDSFSGLLGYGSQFFPLGNRDHDVGVQGLHEGALTQKELATRMGTTASAIARLEALPAVTFGAA
ncbi:MAG TPA: helix-turn-helix transcriptional regulator [Pseudonocardiaceae bacterium]|nr:helix-turn-helix transcriptional regulator [Pseudonocardiaceae bacterium]